MYLPQEDLARFGVSEADLAAGRVAPDFIRLLEFEIARTEAYYRDAAIGVSRLAAGRWGVMAGLEIYQAILVNIRRNNYDVFTRRAGANGPEKLCLALKALWRVSSAAAMA